MNDRDLRRLDRLTRVQTFGKTHAADFAVGGTAQTNFAALDRVLRQIEVAKADQTPSRVSKSTLIDALVLDFRNLTRTARAIELTSPGFASPYRIPDTLSESTVITHAHVLLALLEDADIDTPPQRAAKNALRTRFVDYELPADFVSHLRADLDALKEARQLNQTETQAGVESTAELSALLAQAQEIVTHLDAIIHNKYARVPQQIREWQSASHLERTPQRARATTNTAVAAPPAATVLQAG